MTGIYVPHTKQQLFKWLIKYYPQDISLFRRMPKKQLYAVFFSTVEKIKIGRA